VGNACYQQNNLSPDSILADAERVRAACAGDEAAFAELYKAGYGKVVARIIAKGFPEPEYLAQRAWVRAWEKRETYIFKASFLSWVTAIAENLAKDDHRRRSRFERIISRSFELIQDWTHSARSAAAHEGMEHQEKRAVLFDALEQLSPAHREILELREFQGYSYDEMATILNCPKGTVMSRLNAARKQLIYQSKSNSI
jgi:RNA polymerase sigma-70 factor (ECF subfamily)